LFKPIFSLKKKENGVITIFLSRYTDYFPIEEVEINVTTLPKKQIGAFYFFGP